MMSIIAIIVKEFKLLFRDIGGLVMLFILPVSFIIVLSIALQGVFSSPDKKEKLEILVVNKDRGDVGEKLIKGLEETGYFKAIYEIDNQKLTINKAKKALQKGRYKIIINIPEGTTKAINFQKNATIDIFIDPVLSSDFASHITNALQNFVYLSVIKNINRVSGNIFDEIKSKRIETINKQLKQTKNKRKEISNQLDEFRQSEMEAHIKTIVEDLSNKNIEELNEKIKELKTQKKELTTQKISMNNNKSNDLFKNNIGLMVNQIYYTSSGETNVFPNSVQQNVPGWTIFALFWIAQILTINLIRERESGAFKRIVISPISTFQFIIGKITPFFIINIIQAIFMFSIGVFILPLFGCPSLTIKNIIGIILITTGISFSAISLGLLLASVSKTLSLAASLSAAILILMTVVGGIMVPKFVMPHFMQKMSMFVPHGWALDGYLKILVKDCNILEILPNFFVLLFFALLFFVISLFYFNKIVKSVSLKK